MANVFVKIFLGLLLIGTMMTIGFLLFSAFTWLVCWAFDLTFEWKYSFGLWLVWMLVYQTNHRPKC